MIVLGLALMLACALPSDLVGPAMPTVDVTALAQLTAPASETSLPPSATVAASDTATTAPSATGTATLAGPTPSLVPSRTAPSTATVTTTATVTLPPSATSRPAAAATLPPPPPAAPANPLTPPVNRNNDVTGPVTGNYALTQVVSFISHPVALEDPRDGSGRLFVASQEGRISIIQNGVVLPTPFLDIDPLVAEAKNEQGFLGMAFHPNYAQNGYFYVHYVSPDLYNIVERYTVSATDPNQADPTSNLLMLRVQSTDGTHNGGQMAFGPYDGDLYIGMGDGGGANDPHSWAQNLSVLRGKILRLDVNSGGAYAIPPENPFKGTDGSAREIWAYGFRNPWRFSFDRARGDLWIADVGQENTEEIDFQQVGTGAGLNYGWPLMEGFSCNLGVPCEGRNDLIKPLQHYFHQQGRCAVIGGYVYRGPSLPGLTGAYIYGDYCSGEIWAMRFNAAGDAFFETRLMDTNLNISSFGQDAAGEIYVLSLSGEVYRITSF
jgi:glucose/arabinose dehydrogenase